jgi:hypothetical protein
MPLPTSGPGGADEHDGPDLVGDDFDPTLTVEACDIEAWLHTVAQGALLGMVRGHRPDLEVPARMLETGPLREACLQEFAFRAVTAQLTARNLSHLVLRAPAQPLMDFFATHLLDEARHADVFRWHLVELGTQRRELDATIAALVGDKRQSVLEPLQAFATEAMAGADGDFMLGVVFVTVIAEGAMIPAAEMSERKWRLLDPPGSDVSRGANLDEIRHWGVGTSVVREYAREHPDERARLLAFIERGLALWEQLPVIEILIERERLFQEGLEQHRYAVGNYELVPGRPLAATTIEERVLLQVGWTAAMQRRRLALMGLLTS